MGRYTKEFGQLVDTVITECSLFPAVDYTKGLPAPYVIEEAMWDTGADICVIQQEVADALGLVPYRQVMVEGVHGAETKDVYLVHVK